VGACTRSGTQINKKSRKRRGLIAALLGGALFAAPALAGPASADTMYVGWSGYLSGWTDTYEPSSSNDCVAGRPQCMKATLKELSRIFDSTGRACSHNAVFPFAYLRITQNYAWTRDIPGYYQDVRFANHQDAVFAKYYTDAYNNWASGNRSAVPQAWLTAFDAAQSKTVTGTGDLLLGMNAHINRDLPFVVASVGLVAPDGSSRKPDFDKVEEFLADAAEPMLAEAATRFDSSLDDADEPTGLAYGSVMQLIEMWRENAWRNAERLVSAQTPEERAQVAASIEAEANATAQGILLTNSYTPPLNSTVSRDRFCALHKNDAAPMRYPGGTFPSWGY
jgi:hypothetical protein